MEKLRGMSRRMLCCLMCCLFVFCTPAAAFAGTYSVTTVSTKKTVDLSGYNYSSIKAKYSSTGSKESAKAATSMKGTLTWATVLRAKFTGTSKSTYSGKTKCTKIVQTDTFKASGVGSVSVTGGGTGASVSGSTATFKYSATSTKSLVNSVSYSISKGLTFSATITTASVFTWSNYNLRVECGDAG